MIDMLGEDLRPPTTTTVLNYLVSFIYILLFTSLDIRQNWQAG